jgi:3-dehydro-4-phosphotetronate decarboxylase
VSGTGEIRAQLVRAGRHLTDLGLSPGTSGNVSARAGENMLMSPTGVPLGELTTDELSVVSLDGTHLDGPRPSKEHPLHAAFYRREPHTAAVVHLHSLNAVAVSLLPSHSERSAIAPLTPYFVMRVGQTPAIPYAPPGDPAQAELIRSLPFRFRAVLLRNHGPVTSGTSVDEAVAAAVELEEVSKVALAVRGADTMPLSGEEAAHLASAYGSFWDPATE